MDTATKLQCRHCERTTHLSEYHARISGWRIWSGTTVSGRQASDVVCPYCAGTREAPPWWEWPDEQLEEAL